MRIEVKNISKSFLHGDATLQVLNGISFSVAPGECLSILGPSGCGKTTILKIIAGVERPDVGKIEISEANANTNVPIVWQEHRLLPWRTVHENVRLPLELREVEKKRADEVVNGLLGLVGLDLFSDYYIWKLSGGMKARVAIARALVAGSDGLLLDEPFAAIDYQTKQQLLREMERIRLEKNLTLVYVTHDIRDALNFSDRIVVLAKRPSRIIDTVRPKKADLPHSELEERLWKLLSVDV